MPSSVIKKRAVSLEAAPLTVGGRARRTPRASPSEGTDGPTVAIRRNGDAVEAIEVTCVCGRHMVLDCVYGESDEASAPSEPHPGETG
jgi:hypothetical protein